MLMNQIKARLLRQLRSNLTSAIMLFEKVRPSGNFRSTTNTTSTGHTTRVLKALDCQL